MSEASQSHPQTGWTREQLAASLSRWDVDIRRVESVGEILSYESPEESASAINDVVARFPKLKAILASATQTYTTDQIPRKVPVCRCLHCTEGQMHSTGPHVLPNGKRGLGRIFVCGTCGNYASGR